MNASSSDFKHQSVRDLAWAVLSPPLVSQMSQSCVWPNARWYQDAYDESLLWLLEIDRNPSELERLLEGQKDRRLGKYFETLWFYWFSNSPRYEMVGNNLQIIVDGETLGEIDFIVLDKVTDKLVHWEVAVKFYLGLGDTRKMCNWHGPNYRDRLDIKVDHLQQRQSMLSKDPRVEEWLRQKGLSIDQCAVILKGRLYYPWHGLPEKVAQKASQLKESYFLRSVRAPVHSSLEHLRSWWFKESEFTDDFSDEQRFSPLVKQGWLEKIPTILENNYFTKSDIFKTISDYELRLPLQVQVKNPCHSWDRVFIVSDNWPDDIS